MSIVVAAGRFVALTALFGATVAAGEIFYVDPAGGHIAPFATSATAATNIQAAVDAAAAGATVLVGDGVYRVAVEIVLDKAVILRGANGAGAAHVSAGGLGRVFRLAHSNAVIEGLTIRDGYAVGSGGGVLFDPEGSGGALINCVVTNNHAAALEGSAYGGGVDIWGDAGGLRIVRNCLIAFNVSEHSGGGISVYLYGAVENCTIVFNRAEGADGYGGGLWADGDGVIVENTLVFDNTSVIAPDLHVGDFEGAPGIRHCAAPGLTGNHNINGPPAFIDAATGDFRLADGEYPDARWAGIDGGIDRAWMIGVFDLAGRPRILGAGVDIGAYEYPDYPPVGVVPVAWYERFGLSPDSAGVAAWADLDEVDSDDDGMRNREEYVAGTDPTDAASVFRLTVMRVAPGRAPQLEWLGGTGGAAGPYVIRRTGNPGDAAGWETMGTVERLDGVNTWTGPEIEADRAVYQVLALPDEE